MKHDAQAETSPAPDMSDSSNLAAEFNAKGWCRFSYDRRLAEWVAAALPHARATLTDPAFEEWHRYGGTWFAGVNALPNDGTGAVPGGPPVSGMAVDFIRGEFGLRDLGAALPWDRAQVSVCYPGYPMPMEGESKAVFDFRQNRDAAHVDGLLREGPNRRRRLKEFHAFILGIPLVEYSENAAPFSLWEGSHLLFGDWFRETFDHLPVEQWAEIDITNGYQRLRKQVFETCKRITVHARPGEAYLAHRHILHGMAPWGEDATASLDGRMVAYFRPALPDPVQWLDAD